MKLTKEVFGDFIYWHANKPYMPVDVLERVLEQGVRVYSGWHSHERGHSTTDRWSTDYWPTENATHSALLIGITPIKRDTAESLLRELVERHEGLTSAAENPRMKLNNFIERARKVVGK